LLRARAYYFFFFGAIGCYALYINLYFAARGLNGAAIGLLAALPPAMLVIGGPVWGALADRFRLHQTLLPLVTFAPVLPILRLGQTGEPAEMLLLVGAASFFSMAAGPLIDSAVLDLVAGTRHTFGSVRVWGTLGFIVASLGMGALLPVGLDYRAYGPIFVGYAVGMAAAGAAALGLPARRRALSGGFGAGLRELLRQPAFALFLPAAFLVGAATQAAFSFYPLHLQQLGATAALIGLAGSVSAVSEIPSLFYARALLHRLSAWGASALGVAGYAARWLLVALARDPAAATATQVLQGLSFGPWLVGGVAYVDARTPPGLSATAQAVFTATQWGLGAAIGAAAGGWAYEHLGAAGFFVAASGVNVAGLSLILAASRYNRG